MGMSLLATAAEGAPAAVPPFLGQVVALLVAAATIGYLSVRLRVVPIVGFLVAGVVIGPHALGLVQDTHVIEQAAEIGVILLLFTIGIEFSLERLARIRRMVLLGGGAQVVGAVVLTVAILSVAGVALRPAIFTGFLVALSSTAIVVKMLADKGETTSPTGSAALAFLVFQDLAVVLMVLLVPLLSGGVGNVGLELARALGTAAVVIALTLVVARKLMPPLLEAVARACSPEVFLLTVIALCLGTAYLTAAAGVSLSLGAFLAGLVVSESRHSVHALGEILPLQILFSAGFFLSVGTLLDVRFLADQPLLVVGALAVVLVVKLASTFAGAVLVGTGAATAASLALLLAQIGEFSFVLERIGRGAGLTPAGLGEDGSQAFVAATVLLMIATPALAGGGRRLQSRLGAKAPAPAQAAAPAGGHGSARDHVVISGWGQGARQVAADVRAAGHEVTVVTLNPDGAAEAEADGFHVVRGDSTKQAVLAEAGIAGARMVVIADDEPEAAMRIATRAAKLSGDVPVIVRTEATAELAGLAAAGVTHVVSGERSSIMNMTASVLQQLDDPRPGATQVDVTRVVADLPDAADACAHAATIAAVLPSAAGCEDCLRSGDDWVHLRVCRHCGYVGCCDSSPNRHARKHAGSQAHPVIQSVEPGERWLYCFLDDTAMSLRPR